ncbi:MAG TPA: 3-hydroxyacyl-CoA dehydrogenase family protein, partial [Candidatus Tectomicrobia bacterium]
MLPEIGVVGAGRMGISLAHLNSSLGMDTVIIGRPDPTHLRQARDALAASFSREVRRGRQTQPEAESALARVQVSSDYAALADCEAVIEAVYEELEAKRQVLSAAEAVMSPRCIYLSATSSIPATFLRAGAQRPARVIVTHYIWPAHRRALVEMAAPVDVEPNALEHTLVLLRKQDKQPIRVRDTPGFVVSRVLAAYWSEVFYLVRDGAPPQQIDNALEAFGWPMGPCRMMDTVG